MRRKAGVARESGVKAFGAQESGAKLTGARKKTVQNQAGQAKIVKKEIAMTEKELLKLKKSELLEIMLAQSKEIDSLREQLAEAEEKLASRKIAIKESGSIAEASLKLTQIFEEAQKAADLYVDNVKRRARMEEKKARQKAEEGAGSAAAEAGAVSDANANAGNE